MSLENEKPPGGEALRRRLTELWKRWDDKLQAKLENGPKKQSGKRTKRNSKASFNNLDVLTIVSHRDFPNGRELGQISWDAYQRALKVEASLKKRVEGLGPKVVAQIAKEIAAYGEDRELAGYRGAQLEMLVADHVANLKTADEGRAAKQRRSDQRLELLVAYVRTNGLTLLFPGTIAADTGHLAAINSKFGKAFGSIDRKQLERELTKAFGILRGEALQPYVEGLKSADRTPSVLLGDYRDQLAKQLKAKGVSLPRSERQFRDAIERALAASY